MSDLPFQAEYAKTGRGSCKACKQPIQQGELKIAIMVQSAFHDGKDPKWHHENCIIKTKRPESVVEIAHFNKLTHKDQQRLKELFVPGNLSSLNNATSSSKSKKGKGTKRLNNDATAFSNFSIEYAKSSRATCKHCDIKICKDEIRISKSEYDAKYGVHPTWHHVKCFVEKRQEFLFFAGGENIPGFDNLKKEDRTMIKNEIKKLEGDAIEVKKMKLEPKEEGEIKQEQKKIKKQNEIFHKYRSALTALSKSNLNNIIEHNSLSVPQGKDNCLDLITDCMTFGVPERCPECKNGQLVLDTFNYKCTGDISEWSKCRYTVKEPVRKPITIPTSLKKLPPFDKYKPKVSVRVFEFEPAPVVLVKKEENSVKKEIPLPPLKNLQFFIHGKSKNSKEDIKHRILKMGGLVLSKLTDTCAAVISTKQELEKMNNKMQQIQDKDIEVVEESFLDLIDPATGTVAQTIQLIKENNIADWGSDPIKRVPQDVIDGKLVQKSGSNYVSEKSKMATLKIKGGTAVDPDSGLMDEAHVYQDHHGVKYTTVLSKTDVIAGKNSYYKLQLLQSDSFKKHWLFRSWGRIGTTSGGHKLDNCKTLHDAIETFETLYKEKTKNRWEEQDNFIKMPECYYPVDMDYGDEPQAALDVDTSCKLDMPVQILIKTIFDINTMKKTLLEFELDTEKMPLGKLSKKQIKSGYNVLSELLDYIGKGQQSLNKIIDGTNRFYTLIPHNFGTDNPPLLDNIEAIKSKTEMLDNLLEIEIAYSLLKTEPDNEVSPIEAHYNKLKAEITVLDRNSEEFAMISEYTKNTHAATHSDYTLVIQQVFKVVREGEEKRYKPFKKLHNRRLLWHGSRVTNFAGILSQGLRIAPPEAPITGYMFGKGIYFADMVSKSANYCATNKNNRVGLMLLSEVALGNMKECSKAEYVEKLPAGIHSVWGLGRSQPAPAEARVLPDGTMVPLGRPEDNPVKCTLLYNEFVVYDVAQVNVKYLIQMEFKFRY